MKTIGVIGAGAWGTALAQVLSKGGRDVKLWARETEVVQSINQSHENKVFLKGIPLHNELKAYAMLEDVAKQDILLIVTPAQHVRTTLEKLRLKDTKKPIIICAKGIELETGLLMSQVANEIYSDNPVAILTGPTFASEIAKGLPGAVTLAINDKDLGAELQESIGVKHFRPYVTDDKVGAQLGGAVKNVVAIACGIVTGRRLGESARAALLTRGIAEIGRLAIAIGGRRDTLLGMCGVGDLMLTCSSMQSRNYSLGMALGEGRTLDEILGERNAVTEGVHTASSTLALAKKNAVDMPITSAVNKTLNEGMKIDDAIEEMLNRPFKYEMSAKK